MQGVVRRVKRFIAARGDSRGQLLIEVLIALALLGVIATVFIGAMYTALQSARIADERSIAVTLAKSEIEYVKQQGYSTTDGEWAYMVDSTGSYADPGPEPSWWATSQPPAFSEADFAGYSVVVTGTGIDLDNSGEDDESIRRITATAHHNGTDVVTPENAVLTLENFELDR